MLRMSNVRAQSWPTSSSKKLCDGPLPLRQGPIFKVRCRHSQPGAWDGIAALLKQLHDNFSNDRGCRTSFEEARHGTRFAAVAACKTTLASSARAVVQMVAVDSHIRLVLWGCHYGRPATLTCKFVVKFKPVSAEVCL